MLLLQRSVGNHAVVALVNRRNAPATRWLQRVDIAGKKTKVSQNNFAIFSDALDAILDCQNADISDPDSWLSWLHEINTELATNGVSAKALTEIEAFYAEAAELSFFSNPVLAEVWRRCMDSTRKNSLYARVGAKFHMKLPQVLAEIKADFPALAQKCNDVISEKVNKEHQINKGKKFGGPAVNPLNLQYGAVPPSGSVETLSEFHKGLHALKSGTGKVNYDSLNPAIRLLIEKQQKLYTADAMGKLDF